MSESVWTAVIAGLALIVGAIFQAPRLRNTRADVLRDIEIYNAMPSDLSSKAQLKRRIDRDVSILATGGEKRRDGPSIVIGLLFLATSGWLTWQLFTIGQAWWWFGSPVLFALWLIGLVGTVQGVTKHHRTASGRIIKPQALSTDPVDVASA
ncbi:hypothetical protein [Rathayibacter sp. AY1F9]|uniref:hypothetical protein n=1 Tax=Rathayibacter sp. AY1F9 TaxID=2080563 RepID=UPI000CE76254|nr:hypothetical protein [Rathayibacter sp. AY1F9]PPH27817.1 hypothetical protein C5C37_12365 [Rathayibacter sp. AY1F9]